LKLSITFYNFRVHRLQVLMKLQNHMIKHKVGTSIEIWLNELKIVVLTINCCY